MSRERPQTGKTVIPSSDETLLFGVTSHAVSRQLERHKHVNSNQILISLRGFREQSVLFTTILFLLQYYIFFPDILLRLKNEIQ